MLEFNLHDLINIKEETILGEIKGAFEGQNMLTQYSVLCYRIDPYFHGYKLAIEFDELVHKNREINYEIERQKE